MMAKNIFDPIQSCRIFRQSLNLALLNGCLNLYKYSSVKMDATSVYLWEGGHQRFCLANILSVAVLGF